MLIAYIASLARVHVVRTRSGGYLLYENEKFHPMDEYAIDRINEPAGNRRAFALRKGEDHPERIRIHVLSQDTKDALTTFASSQGYEVDEVLFAFPLYMRDFRDGRVFIRRVNGKTDNEITEQQLVDEYVRVVETSGERLKFLPIFLMGD
jgi:hypothetical protein